MTFSIKLKIIFFDYKLNWEFNQLNSVFVKQFNIFKS